MLLAAPACEGDADIGTAALQRFGDVGRRFDDGFAAGVAAGHDQRFACAGQRLHDDIDFLVQAFSQIVDRRRRAVQRVSDGEAEARLFVHRRAVVPGGDVVQTGVVDVGGEQRVLGVLTDVLHRRDLPVGHALRRRHRAGFPLDGLAHGQRDTRTGLRQVFAQHQHRVVIFDLTQRRRMDAAVFQHVQHQRQA